jgi:hypothetical protein
MPPVEFEPAIPPSERSQTQALDLAATGIGSLHSTNRNKHQASAWRRSMGVSMDENDISVTDVSTGFWWENLRVRDY